MKKTLSVFLSIVLFLALCPSFARASSDGFLRTPWLSPAYYTPAQGNCLYIYVPLTGKKLSCTVEIRDAQGNLVMREERTGLSTNVQTFLWDARPAKNNRGGYDPAGFAPSGAYSVSISVKGSGVEDSFTLPLQLTEPGTDIDEEEGIPNYTGDAECDYLAGLILQEIDVEGLSDQETYHKIYTWVEETLYRENSTYVRPLDETGYYYDLTALASQVKAYGSASDALHEQGMINYDVHGDLETSRAKKMMLERVGTCYEFSALLQILLEHVGIECHVWSGYFHNSDGSVVVHKWNLVRLGGTYYWSDVRIDNASYEHTERTKLFYDYYMEENTDVWKKRHSWDEKAQPVLTTSTAPIDPNSPDAAADTPAQNEPSAQQDPEQQAPEGGYMSAPYPLSSFPDMKNRKTVTTSASIKLSDGRVFLLEAYNIDGYNYFKLRDVACLLTGTRAQFDVGWSELFNLVFLFPGDAYTPVAGDLEYKSLKNPTATPSTNRIMFWGDEISLCAYVIADNNYFRLRDLAILFNFGVDWDEAENMILLTPELPYTE